ncbi:MAG: glycosyltransferase [Deltaproteobacteria bacterium]|nr:glycosyltransferase [Deltaproteobacteria bacterium]
MEKRLQEMVSVCIVGDAGSSGMEACIARAGTVTDRIFSVDTVEGRDTRSGGSRHGIVAVDKGSLSSAMRTEWVLFLRPDESVRVSSAEDLRLRLCEKGREGYLVCVKDGTVRDSLRDYQFIGNLGQYEKMGEQVSVTRLECRLARKGIAGDCLEALVGGVDDACRGITHVVNELHIDAGARETPAVQEDIEGHDMRHLKGEIYYGPVPGEGIDELSSGFIGFRVLHERYLESFLESAARGFGIDTMYLPMIDHLSQEGNFEGARALLEAWTKHRDGDETIALCRAAGFVYGHLLMLDEAIAWYGKSNDLHADPSISALLGELYLVKGDIQTAMRFLKESIDIQPSPFHGRLLATISSEGWKPPTLSLCMIARDEEQTIGRALDSVKGIVDEIIVVDTGSSDGTREIVKECGGRVVESEWQDDFSAARNVALHEAGGAYVLFLDADEYIDPRDRLGLGLLKKLLPSDGNAAYRVRIRADERLQELSVSLLNEIMQEEVASHQVRILPKSDRLFFTGAAFESLVSSIGKTNMKVLDAKLFTIIHGKDNGAFRDERRMPAVRKTFDSPGDPSAILKGALFFLNLGDLDQAYAWFERTERMDPNFMLKVAKLYASQGRHDRAEAIIQKALNNFPDSLELTAALAEVYFRDERYADVHTVLHGILDPDDKEMTHGPVADAFYHYGVSLVEMGRVAEGIRYIAGALEQDPLDTRYRIGGLYALARSEQWDRFLEASERIITQEGIPIDFEIGDFADIGRLVFKILQHLAGAGKQDELRICNKILQHLIRTRIVEESQVDRMEKIMKETSQMLSCMGS